MFDIQPDAGQNMVIRNIVLNIFILVFVIQQARVLLLRILKPTTASKFFTFTQTNNVCGRCVRLCPEAIWILLTLLETRKKLCSLFCLLLECWSILCCCCQAPAGQL